MSEHEAESQSIRRSLRNKHSGPRPFVLPFEEKRSSRWGSELDPTGDFGERGALAGAPRNGKGRAWARNPGGGFVRTRDIVGNAGKCLG